MLNILKSNSFLLFGARGSGKTTLLREMFAGDNVLWIDLLEPVSEERYLLDPGSLRDTIAALVAAPEWVVIDEVQKVPKLLDVVHSLIEDPTNRDRRLKFALTGSSARKLKRGAANLLAGRAFTYHLYPLTFVELGNSMRLDDALSWGTLPFVLSVSDEAEIKAFLRSYVDTYLKEEVLQEQLVRNIVPFRKFLPIAAQCSGTILNYTTIANELRVDWSTVRNYFEILEDTLLGFLLPSYSRSLRKQQLRSPKFYLFDTGIKRALDKTLNVPVQAGQIMEPLFEQFIICEMHRLNSYLQKDFSFSYLATQGGLEIDVVIERPAESTAFVEIKSTKHVQEQHLRHLLSLAGEVKDAEFICLYQGTLAYKVDDVLVIPWVEGLQRLGLG